MKVYHAPDANLVTCITHGSHLYGTSTETSDHDFKCIYLPERDHLLLGRKPEVYRYRFGPDGSPWSIHTPMPPGSWEAEHSPIQKFMDDYMRGQAYAVELVFAVLQKAHVPHWPEGRKNNILWGNFYWLCNRIQQELQHKSLAAMIGFAVKQVFDYVLRGERYNRACELLRVLETFTDPNWKLNHVIGSRTILDIIVSQVDVAVGSTVNNGRVFRTLRVNDRDYMDTTKLNHLIPSVRAFISKYGERSTAAAFTAVDWKSMSHAVRVYEQVIEFCNTRWMTFPRPNATKLVKIKRGEVPVEEVHEYLRYLEKLSSAKLNALELPVSDTLQAKADSLLISTMNSMYAVMNLPPGVEYRNSWD